MRFAQKQNKIVGYSVIYYISTFRISQPKKRLNFCNYLHKYHINPSKCANSTLWSGNKKPRNTYGIPGLFAIFAAARYFRPESQSTDCSRSFM